jgi:hypothetical protein
MRYSSLACQPTSLAIMVSKPFAGGILASLGGRAFQAFHGLAITAILVVNLMAVTALRADEEARLVRVQRIWDQAPHNAFTDLVRFQDQWFCVFREGKGHVSPDGALRVITSKDGKSWESAALITSENSDLRDAKITISPDGQLVLAGAEALHDKSEKTHQSLVWFSPDGREWSDRHEVADPNFWLWRITWHRGKAYGVGYSVDSNNRAIRLYQSDEGKEFTTLVKTLRDGEYSNESAIVFSGDTAYCLLRRDGNPSTGLLGIAEPPYTSWEWKDLGVRIGGPDLIQLPDGRWVGAVRLYDEKVRTSLVWIDPEDGTLKEFLTFPSGGDTSYPGLVWHDDRLFVSYYSTHEGKSNIYFAEVEFSSKP